MDKFNSIDEILDFAIGNEIEAEKFYLNLASKMSNDKMKNVFEGFADEEFHHKEKLEEMKKLKTVEITERKVNDLKIADFLVEAEAGPDMTYQEAITIAMKKEKSAFKLYTRLADITEEQSLRDTFLRLAQEEAKHKLRFELEYDEIIMKEN